MYSWYGAHSHRIGQEKVGREILDPSGGRCRPPVHRSAAFRHRRDAAPSCRRAASRLSPRLFRSECFGEGRRHRRIYAIPVNMGVVREIGQPFRQGVVTEAERRTGDVDVQRDRRGATGGIAEVPSAADIVAGLVATVGIARSARALHATSPEAPAPIYGHRGLLRHGGLAAGPTDQSGPVAWGTAAARPRAPYGQASEPAKRPGGLAFFG